MAENLATATSGLQISDAAVAKPVPNGEKVRASGNLIYDPTCPQGTGNWGNGRSNMKPRVQVEGRDDGEGEREVGLSLFGWRCLFPPFYLFQVVVAIFPDP